MRSCGTFPSFGLIPGCGRAAGRRDGLADNSSMALEVKLGQDLRLRQQLVMTPQLQQAIKILQLSLPELEAIVQSELEQNPMLEPLDQSPAEAASESEASEPEAPADGDGEPLPPEADGLASANSDDDWETGSREEKPAAASVEVEARDA